MPEPLFVLDLAVEPARTDFELPEMRSDIGGDAPELLEDGDVVAVFLGARKGKSWFLILDDRGEASEPVTAGTREDLLFLAGECAGLLFSVNWPKLGKNWTWTGAESQERLSEANRASVVLTHGTFQRIQPGVDVHPRTFGS